MNASPEYRVSLALLVLNILVGCVALYTSAAEFYPQKARFSSRPHLVIVGLQLALALAVASLSIFYLAAPERFLISSEAKEAAVAVRVAEERIVKVDTSIQAITSTPPAQLTDTQRKQLAQLTAERATLTQVKENAMLVCQQEARAKGLPFGPADPYVSACLRAAYTVETRPSYDYAIAQPTYDFGAEWTTASQLQTVGSALVCPDSSMTASQCTQAGGTMVNACQGDSRLTAVQCAQAGRVMVSTCQGDCKEDVANQPGTSDGYYFN